MFLWDRPACTSWITKTFQTKSNLFLKLFEAIQEKKKRNNIAKLTWRHWCENQKTCYGKLYCSHLQPGDSSLSLSHCHTAVEQKERKKQERCGVIYFLLRRHTVRRRRFYLLALQNRPETSEEQRPEKNHSDKTSSTNRTKHNTCNLPAERLGIPKYASFSFEHMKACC